MESIKPKTPRASLWRRTKNFLAVLGPGFVTGAADDDPSGIVTYSQTGAQFGLGQLWLTVFMLPLMVAIQEMAARIGVVTGKGITAIIKENYSRQVLYVIVLILFVANTINLGADLGAMAESARLIYNLPVAVYLIIFFGIILLLEIQLAYHQYAKVLKWLTLVLFSYFLTGFIVSGNWGQILRATFLPHLEFNFQFLLIVVGVLGTTISPYMFFWQAAQEVEEERDQKYLDQFRLPNVPEKYLANMRLDTFVGMFFSELATWFIIITTAAVLHNNGVTDISTAAQAAAAIEPLVHVFPHAGKISEILFSAGIIGTGFLAIPIFAASSSYAVSEIFEWNEGLSKTFSQARNFYLVIILGCLVGLLINFIGINPIKALVYTAILNGFAAVPIIFLLIKITGNKAIMGPNTSGFWSRLFSWLTFGGMASAALLAVYNFLFR